MKIEKLEKVFIALNILSSLFYVTANFYKPISSQLALAQLIFSVAVILICKNNIYKMIYFLYAIAQIIPIYCYFIYGGGFWIYRFNNDKFIIKSNAYIGILFHSIIIIFALYIIYLKTKKSKGEKNAN